MSDLKALTQQMRENSERWFPETHSADHVMPLSVFYALGLSGEVGEVANDIKKLYRDHMGDVERTDKVNALGVELADCLTYLLLLADEMGVDIEAAYHAKAQFNERRWGAR